MRESRFPSQYLKYFSSVDADRFAIIRVSGDILHEPEQARQVASALSFLHRVGLVPVVVHGAGIFTGRHTPDVAKALQSLAAANEQDEAAGWNEASTTSGGGSASAAARAAALEAGGRYLRAANEALVAELQRAGVPTAAFPTGVFECEPDDEYTGPLRGLVGRILHSDGTGDEDEDEDEEEEEREGPRTGGI